MIHQLYYAGFCVGLALVNALLIQKNKVIHHWINGLLHILVWAVLLWWTHSAMLLAVLPFIGRLVFDSSLNLMRGLSISYMPKDPKSWVDRVEGHFFENGWEPKLFYGFAIILINVVNSLVP